MIADLLTQPCTIITRTESEDDELDLQVSEESTSTVCYLDPGSGQEAFAEGDTVNDQATLYVPDATSLDHASAVTVDGVTYEITGDPARFYNPRLGTYSHKSVQVRRSA